MRVESADFPPVIPRSDSPEEVLSRLANELEHPINAIKGWADLILRGTTDHQEAAEKIYSIAENMEILQSAVIEYLRARGTLE